MYVFFVFFFFFGGGGGGGGGGGIFFVPTLSLWQCCNVYATTKFDFPHSYFVSLPFD